MVDEMQQMTQLEDESKLFLTPFEIRFYVLKNPEEIARLNKQINSLPQTVQDLLTDFSTAEYMEDKLRPDFNLSEDQVIKITKMVGDILMGTIYFGDFVSSVQVKLGLDLEKSKQLVNKVLTELLSPAINDIKKVQQEKFSDRIKNPNSKPNPVATPAPQKPPVDPIISSQRVGGVVDLRSTRPEPKPQNQTQPPQPQPTQPRPPQPPPQPQNRPPTPQPIQQSRPPQESAGQNQNQPQNLRPPQPQVKSEPQPNQQSQARPGVPSGMPKEFKMPPPLQGEPVANENTGKTLDLRELDK